MRIIYPGAIDGYKRSSVSYTLIWAPRSAQTSDILSQTYP